MEQQHSEDSLHILVVNICGRACGDIYSDVLISICPVAVKIEEMPLNAYVLSLQILTNKCTYITFT